MKKIITIFAFSTACMTSCNQRKDVACNPASIDVLVADFQKDTAFIVKRYSPDGTFSRLIDSASVEGFFTRSVNNILVPTDTVVLTKVYVGYDYSVTIPSTGTVHKIYAVTDDGVKTQRVHCKGGDCPGCQTQLTSYWVDSIQYHPGPAPYNGSIYLNK